MKIKLRKDLPGYPAGTVFENSRQHIHWMPVHSDEFVDDWLWKLLEFHESYPDWFERIDETPLYWEPESPYFYINEDGEVLKQYNVLRKTGSHTPKRIEIGNAFPTKEAAQAHVEYLKALTRVRKYIQEQGFELGNHPTKCVSSPSYREPVEIAYSHGENCFLTHMIGKQLSTVLPGFGDYDHAADVIDNCQDDLETIFGVES